MALNEYEKVKIEKACKENLEKFNFAFDALEVLEKASIIKLVFTGCRHTSYKSVRLMSYESHYEETPLYTRVYINLRFLYGKRESPVVGHKITSFKLILS